MGKTICRGILIATLVGWAVTGQARELLVGSWNTHSIRTYDTDTNQYLGDLVTPGAGGLNIPDGMDFGPDGDLFVSSSGSNAVLRFDGDDGTFLGEFATQRLNQPGNLHFGPDGLLYVANKALGEVVRFDPLTGDLVDVFARGGGLQQPVGLLWDAGMLYVSDFSGNAIRRYDALTGDFIDTFAQVTTPLILNLNSDGDLLVSSHQDDMIWKYDTASGTRLGPALVGGPLNCPVGHLFVDGDLIVASWQNHRLLRYGEAGDFQQVMAFAGGLQLPNDLLLRPVAEPSGGCWLMMIGIAIVARRRIH